MATTTFNSQTATDKRQVEATPGTSQRTHYLPLWVTLLGSLALAALLLVVIGPVPADNRLVDILVRVSAGLLALLLIAWYTRRIHYQPLVHSHQNTTIWRIPANQATALQRSAMQELRFQSAPAMARARAQAQAFTLAVVRPADVRQRLTERYEPNQRTLAKKVTLDIFLNEKVTKDIPSEGSTIQIPVALLPKGEMVDDLRVLGSDNAELPTLSYSEYLRLAARVIRTLLFIGFQGDSTKLNHSDTATAEHMALQGILQRAPMGGGNDPIRDPDYSGRDALLALCNTTSPVRTPSNAAAIRLAAKITEKLTTHYAIVANATCPQDGRLAIKYARLITPELGLARRSEGSINWFKDRMRILFGAKPLDISLKLDTAATARSYHLLVDGQEGVYVRYQKSDRLVRYLGGHWSLIQSNAESSRSNGNIPETPPPPHYRFRFRAGQRYGHLYTRSFPEPIEQEGLDEVPRVRFFFEEVPPGSMFRASVSAVAAALLIWLVGFVVSHEPDSISTDVPAFLLIVPALVGAWLGLEGNSRRLLEGTLPARVSLLFTVLTSMAASGLFIVFRADLPYFEATFPDDMSLLGIKSVAWAFVTAVILGNVLATVYGYIIRAWRYTHLAQRTDPYTRATEHIDGGG